MKRISILSLLCVIVLAAFQLTAKADPEGTGDNCTAGEWGQCQTICNGATPNHCALTDVSCYFSGSSITCGCEMFCSVSSHPGGDPGGFRRLAIVEPIW
jgi:hypothetical protein